MLCVQKKCVILSEPTCVAPSVYPGHFKMAALRRKSGIILVTLQKHLTKVPTFVMHINMHQTTNEHFSFVFAEVEFTMYSLISVNKPQKI